MMAAVLYDKEFFPGEPQIALFMAGRWSRADGFRPFMCQKMRGWAKRRSHAEDASMEVAATGGTRGRSAIRNLPQFLPVTHMEPYEKMVEGLLQLAEHTPDGMVRGMREFFSIQRTHYQACGDLEAMSHSALYADLLDRFDEHAKAIHRMGIGVLLTVPPLHSLPTELASAMLLREQQLKSILTALRSSGVQAHAAIAAVTDDKQKPPAKQPTGETRKEKNAREAAERKAKKAAADAESKKPPPRKSPVKSEPGTGGAPGGGGAGVQTGACFNFMRGVCSHGAACRFSHDASMIDAARICYHSRKEQGSYGLRSGLSDRARDAPATRRHGPTATHRLRVRESSLKIDGRSASRRRVSASCGTSSAKETASVHCAKLRTARDGRRLSLLGSGRRTGRVTNEMRARAVASVCDRPAPHRRPHRVSVPRAQSTGRRRRPRGRGRRWRAQASSRQWWSISRYVVHLVTYRIHHPK